MDKTERLKLRHLRTLIAVAENGSLIRAADALSITQPAVSKSLAELENIVGKRLFERTSKGVNLTSVGRVLQSYAGMSLRALREGLDNVLNEQTGEVPVAFVGALPNVATTVLPPALLRFAASMPQANVTVRTGSNAQLITALHQGILDFVIGRLAEPSDMQGLSFEPLYTELLVLVVRAEHALAGRCVVEPFELGQCRLLLPDASTVIREAADRFFMASGMGLPRLTLQTIDLSFGRSYTLQSDAVWFVPLGAVERELQQGVLKRLPVDTQITQGAVGLTRRTNRAFSEPLLLLLDEVRGEALRRAGIRL